MQRSQERNFWPPPAPFALQAALPQGSLSRGYETGLGGVTAKMVTQDTSYASALIAAIHRSSLVEGWSSISW